MPLFTEYNHYEIKRRKRNLIRALNDRKVLKTKTIFAIFAIFSLMISSISVVSATPTVSIFTEKEIYSYGDFLTFTIEVSEITGEAAILHIIDESGKSSSDIPIPITELKTVIPSPFPFESEVYPLGTYTLEIQYSDSTDTTEFELIDSGKFLLPIGTKQVAVAWIQGDISDTFFMKFLIRQNPTLFSTEQNSEPENVKIPHWVKDTTGWWVDEKISDKEFATALGYLIKKGIILV